MPNPLFYSQQIVFPSPIVFFFLLAVHNVGKSTGIIVQEDRKFRLPLLDACWSERHSTGGGQKHFSRGGKSGESYNSKLRENIFGPHKK